MIEDLNEFRMAEFILWLRYVVFDGDADELFNTKQKDSDDKTENKDLNDDFFSKFKAKSIKPWGLDNEIKVWLKIDRLVDA